MMISNKAKIMYFLLATCLMACSPKKSEQKAIAALELQALAEENSKSEGQQAPGDSILLPLMKAYARYIQTHAEDEMTPIYLYRMGAYYYRMQSWQQAANHFEYVLDGYQESKAYPEALLLAASIYETRVNNSNRAAALYQIYLDRFPDGPERAKAEFFFKPPEEKMRARIGELQSQLMGDQKSKGINRQLAHVLVRQYINYTKKYPNSNFTPTYCMEGAKLASNLGESYDAVQLWTNIYEQYHDFHLYPETILLLGLEYESKMPLYVQKYKAKKDFNKRFNPKYKSKNLEEVDWNQEAAKMYKQFIAKYPNHELKAHAEASLNHLGKSPNEIAQDFRLSLDSLRKAAPLHAPQN